MAKKIKIDLSEDRLLDMASAFLDDGDRISALKMINKNAGLHYADDRSFMLYAEIYDDLTLHEESINYWFRYIDCCPDPDYEEAYEGLAIGYMHLDNEQFSAYYYNKLLMETQDLTAQERREIIDSFLIKDVNPLSFAYPPEKVDYTADIDEGIDHLKAHEPESAIECFSRVVKGNKKYLLARNYIAMTYVLNDQCDKAEEECYNILTIDSHNVQAYTTLAAVREEQKRGEEAVQIARRLVNMYVTEQEDIYKIATVCCENKLHAEALAMFNRMDSDIAETDRNMLFFKAIAAYNCGKYEICFDAFDTLLAIYPDAVVARYYYTEAKNNYTKEDPGEMSYFYRLPVEMREQSLALLSALYSLTDKEARKVADEIDALECIKWCFDETEIAEDNELHSFAALCAVKAGYDDYARDLLLNAFLPDKIKLNMLHLLCERNESNQFGVVVCNVYKCVDIFHIDIGRAKRKKFVSAYAILVSRFGIMDDTYSAQFAAACENVYEQLEKAQALDLCKDSSTLAAVIAKFTKINSSLMSKIDICDFFDANKKQYNNIIAVLDKQ